VPSTGPAADAALAELEAAFAAGTLVETPVVGAMIADLRAAIEVGEGDRVGGKSAEAARFITRAISRELDSA
jgi:ABC-type tungstate transport system substrate-binding protein